MKRLRRGIVMLLLCLGMIGSYSCGGGSDGGSGGSGTAGGSDIPPIDNNTPVDNNTPIDNNTPVDNTGKPFLIGGCIQGVPLPVTGTTSTVAGSYTGRNVRDGDPTRARFNWPFGITTDGTNLYVTDNKGHTILRIVIATGQVTTLAGIPGTIGAGDGPGATATFHFPTGITTDGTNLYVTDTDNHAIRKIVIATGEVSTLAGNKGYTGYYDGTGTIARFNNPHGVTTDGTNLYVTDTDNHVIRKIVIATGAVTTVAGTSRLAGHNDGIGSAALFRWPHGITTDGTYLYVADTFNYRIRKIVIATGEVSTLAGNYYSGWADGTGSAALFHKPRSLAMDGKNLFVADEESHTIRKVVIATGEVTTVAGTPYVIGFADGTGSVAGFNYPSGITTDGIALFVADTRNNEIRRID